MIIHECAQVWKSEGGHIGDIDDFKVLKYYTMYSVWDDGKLIACTSLSEDEIPVVDTVWVDKNRRGEKLLSKLLWFYKSRLGHSKLLLGDTHSMNMQEIVHGGLRRFAKSWYNIDTGEKIKLDPSDLDKYYDEHFPTKWRVMLENSGDFSAWPKFNTGTDFIRENYDWQIE